MSSPQIIILDGPSSVGKSAISRALQEALLPEVWLSYSMDTILDILPRSVLERVNSLNDWTCFDFPAVEKGALAALRSLADANNRIIFDTTLSSPEQAARLLDAVRGLSVTSVAILCAWEEIERRVRKRGDRSIEEVRAGYEAAPKQLSYDITVDTTTLSPEEAAQQILRDLRAAR